MSTDDPAEPPPAAGIAPDAIPAATPPPPHLPEVEQESADDIVAEAPSPEEIIEHAEPAADILAAQPSVDELLGRKPGESG
jgi:hypothetical protein